MLDIAKFWSRRISGIAASGASKLPGWQSSVTKVPGFVEPSLTLLEGDPETAKLLIIAAPGAVGKSSYASALAATTNMSFVDLAKTSPLGGNFFSGGLSKAFGYQALTDAVNGKIGLIVDALDEAHMRAGPEGYESGLLDLAGIANEPSALPVVLLGRAIAAEDAYLLLTSKGYSPCLLQIEFFTGDQAAEYLANKLPIVAQRTPKVAAAFRDHHDPFLRLAQQTREKLMQVAGAEKTQFAGYAPVLDAICEFALDEKELNPQAKLSRLKSTSQIDLIDSITTSILERERGKLQCQFKERHPTVTDKTLASLYTVDEQLERVAHRLFGGAKPPCPEFEDTEHEAAYLDMVERFALEHPFLAGIGNGSNPVFAAYVLAWALRSSRYGAVARTAAVAKPGLMSGLVFGLYERHLALRGDTNIPLSDVGVLYQALNSQLSPGQRVQLEISEEADAIQIDFEILERVDDKAEAPAEGQTWGPFTTTSDEFLELHSPFSNVYIEAPIAVELGDGLIQQIGAPTQMVVRQLLISAKKVLVHYASTEPQNELRTVALIAEEAECLGVQVVDTQDNAQLSVSWPGAKAHPWTNYATEIPTAANADVTFLRRRLRKILTAFRSHSKGALVRLAAKIDHNRMIKDARGEALLNKLIEDRVLVLFDGGKFYCLDPDVMGRNLGLGYHELAQSRFTPESDSYLSNVLDMVGKDR